MKHTFQPSGITGQSHDSIGDEFLARMIAGGDAEPVDPRVAELCRLKRELTLTRQTLCAVVASQPNQEVFVSDHAYFLDLGRYETLTMRDEQRGGTVIRVRKQT